VFLNGIYPRSEKLVQATRDFDRGRLSKEELDQYFLEDLKALIELQQKIRVSHYSDGMLRWQDHFRPFAESVDSIETGPLLRYYDNNTFFRQPVVTGKLRFLGLVEIYFSPSALPRDSELKAVLPSPYTFSRLAEDKYYRHRNALMLDFAEAGLKPIAQELAELGFTFIQLNEPQILHERKVSDEDLNQFQRAIGLLRDSLPQKVRLCLHTFFADSAPIIRRFLDFPVEVIGIDFLETSLEDLQVTFGEKELLCGCVDARSAVIEDAEAVKDFVRLVQDKLAPKAIYLTSNTDLEFTPEPIAKEKMLLIGSVAEELNKENK